MTSRKRRTQLVRCDVTPIASDHVPRAMRRYDAGEAAFQAVPPSGIPVLRLVNWPPSEATRNGRADDRFSQPAL